LEAGRVCDHRCSAVERGELLVALPAETEDPGRIERRLLAPARAAYDGQRKPLPEQALGVDEDPEVLARFERRDREDVLAAEIGVPAVRAEGASDARR